MRPSVREDTSLPLALAELHATLPVGGILDLVVHDGGADPWAGSDGLGDRGDGTGQASAAAGAGMPTFGDLLTGAGFTVEQLDARGPAGDAPASFSAGAVRARSLADTVAAGMRLLVCGLNPSLYAADAGVGYARPGNRFWPSAIAAGVVSVDRDPHAALDDGVGLTDLVKRATPAAAHLDAVEYRAGLQRVGRLIRWLRPGAVCFVGLTGWRTAVDRRARAGVQPVGLAGVPVYVMPSTSGLNARTPLAELTDHLRAAATLADGS